MVVGGDVGMMVGGEVIFVVGEAVRMVEWKELRMVVGGGDVGMVEGEEGYCYETLESQPPDSLCLFPDTTSSQSSSSLLCSFPLTCSHSASVWH